MANESWGLKLDQELKERIQEIIKNDFDNSKEFMNHIVSLYEVDKLKRSGSILNEEIDEMEILSRRMYNVLVNANEKINTLVTAQRDTFEKTLTQRQNTIDTLQRNIADLKEKMEEVSDANDKLVNLNNEYSQRVNQLTDSTSTSAALINEYKEKNAVLIKQLDNIPAYTAKIEELSSVIQTLRDENGSLQSKLNALELRCANLSSELENTKATDEITLKTALIELQQQHQKEIEDIQVRYRTEIDQYQERYKRLLNRLEKPNKKTNSNNTR